jgi:hypothetical protein
MAGPRRIRKDERERAIGRGIELAPFLLVEIDSDGERASIV